MKSFLNAVLYARFSSEKQQESSIAVQLAECKKFCATNNINVVGVYEDEARTGTDGNREAFQQMLADAALGTFNLVVVHRWDRFARNVELALTAKNQLASFGIKVISTVENFDDTPEGEFFNLMSLGMAALYSKRLSREAFNGQIENARHAKAHSGVPLYGYEVVKKKYRLVPKEAEAVRTMFQMVAEGHTYRETIDYLNGQGYTRRDGRPLSYSITDTLRNRQYTGEYIFNLYQRTHVPKTGRRRKLKNESEIVRVPGGLPAVIDTETFDKVQRILDGRKDAKRKTAKRGKYLLTGLIVCGDCGRAVCGEKRVIKNRSYFVYRCGNKKRHDNMGSINVVFMDKYVVNLFSKAFLLMRNTGKVANLIRASLSALHDEKILLINSLKKQLEESKTTLESLEDIIRKNHGKALATVIINDAMQEKQKIAGIETRIAVLREEKSRLPRLNEEKIRWCMQEYKTILSGIDFYARQEALRRLVKEIKVTADTVETTINLSALADVAPPLFCRVTEHRANIASVFNLRGLEFDFDKLAVETELPETSRPQKICE